MIATDILNYTTEHHLLSKPLDHYFLRRNMVLSILKVINSVSEYKKNN